MIGLDKIVVNLNEELTVPVKHIWQLWGQGQRMLEQLERFVRVT
jgi:hypothetical protein